MARINYPKLFESKNDKTKLGRGVLRDCIVCEVTEQRNGIFELYMEYKSDGFLSDELQIGKIIKANASKTLKNQLFRIYDVKKSLNGHIIVCAEHIFFDLRKAFVPRVNPDKPISANTALALILNSTARPDDWIGSSDIDNEHEVLFELKNALECIVGSTGSLVDKWNGDLLRDNKYIYFKKNRGQDRGVHITYTKNMTGFEANENMDDVITGIYPYCIKAKEADTENYSSNASGSVVKGNESIYLKNHVIEIPGTNKYILADNADDFDTVMYAGIDFTNDEFWNSYEMNPQNLEILAKKYFSKTKANIPKCSYEVDLIALSDTEEYKNFSFMEEIDLCDIVTVNNKKFNIKEKVKVTELKYNVLTDKIISLVLGGSYTSLSSSINTKFDEIKDQIDTNKSETEKVIEYVTNQITGNDGGHVKLFPPHAPQEIFIMNNEDPMKATEVLRINKAGIGFGSSINGPFKTGWTASGVFNADFIRTGSMSANLIRSGVLSNINGTVQINLEGNTIDFYKKNGSALQKGININGPEINFYDWMGANAKSGMVSIHRAIGSNGEYGYYPLITMGHEVNGYMNLSYKKNDGSGNYTPYVMFDAYNRSGKNPNGFSAILSGNVKVSNALFANSYRIQELGNNVLYYSNAGNTCLAGSETGVAIVNNTGQTICTFKSDGAIGLSRGFFNALYLNSGQSSKIFANGGTMALDTPSEFIIQLNERDVVAKMNSSHFHCYKTLNMAGGQIVNAHISNSYSDTASKTYVETHNTESLQKELSYTFESTTKGKEVKIYLNKKIGSITSDNYMVQLTAYDDCRIWCKKYNDYFIVHTDKEDVEFSCRVIKKMTEVSQASYKIERAIKEINVEKSDKMEKAKAEEESFDYKIIGDEE